MKKLKPGTVVHSPVLALRWTHHGVNAREASLGARLAKALVRRERELRSYPGQRILTETKKAFIYRNSWSVRAGLQCSSFLDFIFLILITISTANPRRCAPPWHTFLDFMFLSAARRQFYFAVGCKTNRALILERVDCWFRPSAVKMGQSERIRMT